MNIYIICGYGIPEDINSDQNYLTYLNIVFNKIFERSKNEEGVLMPSGGPTSCTPPFQGTEAEVMAEYLQNLMSKEEVKNQTDKWKIYLEHKSLSTLENFLLSQKIIEDNNIKGPITMFCEATRKSRLQMLGQEIFKDQPFTIEAIDFDTTANRYLDQAVIDRKEKIAAKEALWTLEDPERIAKHHEIFEKKLAFLRQRQSEGLSHVEAVTEWFTLQKQVLKDLVPDHPLLDELDAD